MVRFRPDQLAALDRFIAETDASMSRPEAVRIVFKDWAIGHGLLEQDEGS